MKLLIIWLDLGLLGGVIGGFYILYLTIRSRDWGYTLLTLWLLTGLIFVAIQPIYPGLTK